MFLRRYIFLMAVWGIPFPLEGAAWSDSALVYEYSFGAFSSASRIYVDGRGRIYVLDEGENTVSLFKDPSSKPTLIGGYGWTSVTFDRPSAICGDGINIYVADFGNHRVQRFDGNLNYLSTLYTREISDERQRFGYPTGVGLTTSGDLLVLDSENLKIIRFSQNSRFIASFGGIESGPGRLRNPSKIVISAQDRVYVSESTRIQEYDQTGNFVGEFGLKAFINLRGISVWDEKLLVVTSDTLFLFSATGTLESVFPLAAIISAPVGLDSPRDVAVDGKRILLLDNRSVHVLLIVKSP